MTVASIVVDKLCAARKIKMPAKRRMEIAGSYINRYFFMEIAYSMKMKRRRMDIYRAHCEPDAQRIILELTELGVSVYFHNNVYTLSW